MSQDGCPWTGIHRTGVPGQVCLGHSVPEQVSPGLASPGQDSPCGPATGACRTGTPLSGPPGRAWRAPWQPGSSWPAAPRERGRLGPPTPPRHNRPQPDSAPVQRNRVRETPLKSDFLTLARFNEQPTDSFCSEVVFNLYKKIILLQMFNSLIHWF